MPGEVPERLAGRQTHEDDGQRDERALQTPLVGDERRDARGDYRGPHEAEEPSAELEGLPQEPQAPPPDHRQHAEGADHDVYEIHISPFRGPS
jgi:hypothetical protein